MVRVPTGVWKFVIDPKFVADRFSETRTQPIENSDWLETEAMTTGWIVGSETTESVSPGEAMARLRCRLLKTVKGGRGATVDPEPTDGIIVWIQEQ